MSDNELINYIKKVEANFKSHIEKGTIEMSLEYYNLCEELMVRGINAIQENQQLKEQLEVSEKARKEAIKFIKSDKICIDIRKTDGSLDYVDEKELVDILDIDKGK